MVMRWMISNPTATRKDYPSRGKESVKRWENGPYHPTMHRPKMDTCAISALAGWQRVSKSEREGSEID